MIPNGCDVLLFDKAEKTEDPRVVNVIFTGAHGDANGLDAVLDVAAELKRRGRVDICFRLIGNGSQKSRLIERAERETLDNCVFEDPVPKSVLVERFSEFHVGLQVLADIPGFYYGTSPNKFFDYLAGGLPVITNYPGWVAELIEDNNCGIAVPPGNYSAFADAVEELADRPEERALKGRNSRSLAENRFDRRKLAGEFVDLLEEFAAS
jgi:glycosyltransferase involved in cell wall biosynthesis